MGGMTSNKLAGPACCPGESRGRIRLASLWLLVLPDCQKRGLGPVLAVCLSAVSQNKAPDIISAPSSVLPLAPFLLLDLTLNFSFSPWTSLMAERRKPVLTEHLSCSGSMTAAKSYNKSLCCKVHSYSHSEEK